MAILTPARKRKLCYNAHPFDLLLHLGNCNFSEVISIDSKRYKPDKFFRWPHGIRNKQLPVVPFPLSVYSQEPDWSEKCFYLAGVKSVHFVPARLINLQESPYTLVILLGWIDGIQHMSIAVNQCIVVHLRYEIEWAAVSIVARKRFGKAVFFLQSFVQSGT